MRRFLYSVYCGLVGHNEIRYSCYEAASEEENDMELGAEGYGCNVFEWIECSRCGKKLSELESAGHTSEEMNPSLPVFPNGWKVS